uniref:Geminin coiled-coil domain-containing protein 1 n=1 Tax=Oryzias sinensis TaxID=183150 RepID=A0A8C8DRW7_9TELE
MATPTSVWAGDTSDLNERRHELCGPPCVWSSSPPAGWTWEQQFSPHLQRNKQLQDALLQREEELARLQEENCKLREFLSSSFVKSLQEKAEKLGVASRVALKRTLMTRDVEPPRLSTHRLLPSKKVSKRVCRNLMAEFCSETQESPSEPNLDLWVLRTLGLKDRDTIDTSSQSAPDFSIWEGDSSGYTPDSTLDSPVSTATPSSVHSCCPGTASEPDHGFSADPETSDKSSASAGIAPPPGSGIRSFNTWTTFQRPDLCSITGSSPVHSPDRDPAGLPFWSPPPDRWTPPENVLPPPLLTSTPTSTQPWVSPGPLNRTSPSDHPEVRTPRRSTDVAFSMFLRPSSSVKTHSFPQGQAFVRRDTGGRCNFTWVPRQEP